MNTTNTSIAEYKQQQNKSHNKKTGLQVVVGLGQSGLSVVNFLLRHNYQVAVTDGNSNPNLANKLPEEVNQRSFGDIDAQLLAAADRIIISPGIALEEPAVATAKALGIEVVSDIQLFHEAIADSEQDIPIVAITGSNAKSTVTTLVGEMAKDAGVNVGVGGNIGVPALTLLENQDMQLAVLEISSFQLETITNLNAKVATVLNMSPDHLDRHGDMDNYRQLKHRIFDGAENVVINRDDAMTKPDTKSIDELIINTDDYRQDYKAVVSFGSDSLNDDNSVINGKSIDFNGKSIDFCLITDSEGQVYLARGQEKLLNTNELKIKGQHNQLNALAALALGELSGLPLPSMLLTLTNFAGLPHRCQYVANVKGVDYFNDSKGTNMGSTLAAIKGLGESYRTTDQAASLMLILGGQGKGQDFSELQQLINCFVSHIYFIGEDAALIEQQLSVQLDTSVICQQTDNLENTLNTIEQDLQNLAEQSNVAAVLLSPACASFDQFSGYAQRGDSFIDYVTQLAS